MSRPRVGDKVRVQRFIMGRFAGFEEFELEERDFCLGIYGKDGPRTPCNFTPLCEMVEPSPEADLCYWSNYGEYHTKHVQTYEVIKCQK